MNTESQTSMQFDARPMTSLLIPHSLVVSQYHSLFPTCSLSYILFISTCIPPVSPILLSLVPAPPRCVAFIILASRFIDEGKIKAGEDVCPSSVRRPNFWLIGIVQVINK